MGGIHIPPQNSKCVKCTTSCINESLKCSVCKYYVHLHCSELPVYQLTHYYTSRYSYACYKCVQNKLENEYVKTSSFIENLLATAPSEITPTDDASSQIPSYQPPNDNIVIDSASLQAQSEPFHALTEIIAINTKNKFNLLNDTVELSSSTNDNEISNILYSSASPDSSFASTNSDIITCAQRVKTPTPIQSPQPGSIKSDTIKSAILCRFFKQNCCRYGKMGVKCNYNHPKLCEKFKDHGPNPNNGCMKGSNCEFFHQPLCESSFTNLWCYDDKCRKMHLKHTKRIRKTYSTDEQQTEEQKQCSKYSFLEEKIQQLTAKISNITQALELSSHLWFQTPSAQTYSQPPPFTPPPPPPGFPHHPPYSPPPPPPQQQQITQESYRYPLLHQSSPPYQTSPPPPIILS